MFYLIRGGTVSTPDNLGTCDVLICGGTVAELDRQVDVPKYGELTEVDAAGCYVIPGFVEAHTHFLGAGGIFGPASRNGELQLSLLARAGITTAVSPLGSDNLSNTLPRLLMKARALESEGVSTYIYTGGFQKPLPTLTGSILTDLSFIDKVVGVKMAMFEPNASRFTANEMHNILRDLNLGSKLGCKGGVLHVHLGKQSGDFSSLCELCEEAGAPLSHLVLTHVNANRRVMEQAVGAGVRGANLDITCSMTPDYVYEPDAVRPGEALRTFLEAGIPLERISMSSDSNAGVSFKEHPGTITDVASIYIEFKKLVQRDGFGMTDALRLITANPADRCGLSNKGRLAVGKDADVVILDKDLSIKMVIAKGKTIFERGKTLSRSAYETAYMSNLA